MNERYKVVAENRKASFDYFLEDFYEAGIVLTGSEIKSIRLGNANLKDSYVQIKNGELYIINMHISQYDKSSLFVSDPYRTRKLLLNKKEILKLEIKIKEKGYTLIPKRIYLKGQYLKVEICTAKGKKNFDKRETEKNRDIERNIKKAVKDFNK